jgi:hypothetical protein
MRSELTFLLIVSESLANGTAVVVTKNIAALAALGNGMLPLQKIAQIEAKKRHQQELRQSYALERKAV